MAQLSYREKLLAMATEIRIIQLNETHQEHLYVMPDNFRDTSIWTYVFYVLVFLVIAFVLFSFAMLSWLTQRERTEEQRLRTREERFKACNRFCPDCDGVMYEEEEPDALSEEQEPVPPQYYSDGNPAADEWPETDLLSPD